MTTRRPPSLLSLASLLVLSAMTVVGCDQSGSTGSSAKTYTAELTALNGSGVTGTADVTVDGNQIAVSVDADGTTPKKGHAQHIHGQTDGSSSSCPGMTADSDGNGRISVSEGAPAYGGILVPLDGSLDTAEGLGELDTFPVADADGAYTYDASISTTDLAVNEDRSFTDLTLENHAIVVHGAVVDTSYVATLPVACGTLSQSN